MNDAAMQNIAKAPLVEVRNLITRFELKGGLLGRTAGRVDAVERGSFDIFPGESLAVVGESGCGKSTVARSIMQLDKAQSGSSRYDGTELIGASKAALTRFR